MPKTVRVDQLSAALERELTLYSEEVNAQLEAATVEAMNDLVKKTKETAPKDTGRFRRNITSDVKQFEKARRKAHGGFHGKVVKSTWYVKAPDYRLTHLLVKGHAKAGGGRVEGDPFLKNALDEVLPAYEKAVEEAIKNG